MGASEATLLNMLNISPFSYGLIIQQVYDNGSVYSPEVLDITEDALHKRFLEVRSSNTTNVVHVDLFLTCSQISLNDHLYLVIAKAMNLIRYKLCERSAIHIL